VSKILPRFGVDYSVVDSSNLEALRAALKPTTKVVFIETPANPTNKITDIAAVSNIIHDGEEGKKRIMVVDNTFCSPVFQNPLVLGADVVLHSLTKVCDFLQVNCYSFSVIVHQRTWRCYWRSCCCQGYRQWKDDQEVEE